eukprot:UN10640
MQLVLKIAYLSVRYCKEVFAIVLCVGNHRY